VGGRLKTNADIFSNVFPDSACRKAARKGGERRKELSRGEKIAREGNQGDGVRRARRGVP